MRALRFTSYRTLYKPPNRKALRRRALSVTSWTPKIDALHSTSCKTWNHLVPRRRSPGVTSSWMPTIHASHSTSWKVKSSSFSKKWSKCQCVRYVSPAAKPKSFSKKSPGCHIVKTLSSSKKRSRLFTSYHTSYKQANRKALRRRALGVSSTTPTIHTSQTTCIQNVKSSSSSRKRTRLCITSVLQSYCVSRVSHRTGKHYEEDPQVSAREYHSCVFIHPYEEKFGTTTDFK